MNKFKVGDKVRLKDNITSVYLNNNTVYAVDEVFYKKLRVHGVDFKYNDDVFELVSTDFLSPLEAAEAILNDEVLEEYSSSRGEWCSFSCNLHGITLSYLQQVKLRRKPKTVIINGVEVVAPVELPRYTEGYTPSLCHREVQTASAGKGRIMWATKEDAQKALDAMLIPFKQ